PLRPGRRAPVRGHLAGGQAVRAADTRLAVRAQGGPLEGGRHRGARLAYVARRGVAAHPRRRHRLHRPGARTAGQGRGAHRLRHRSGVLLIDQPAEPQDAPEPGYGSHPPSGQDEHAPTGRGQGPGYGPPPGPGHAPPPGYGPPPAPGYGPPPGYGPAPGYGHAPPPGYGPPPAPGYGPPPGYGQIRR